MALRRKHPGGQSEFFAGFSDVSSIDGGTSPSVYSATEAETGRTVALKVLDMGAISPQAIEAFGQETFALRTLSSHPNIVTLFRAFSAPDGRPVLVMERCSESLADLVERDGAMEPAQAVAIAIKICGALETAHRVGMLHRYIKPQKLLITRDGQPALADVGVARPQSGTESSGGVFGFTTVHAAPEMLEGATATAATDVYELASTLYYLLAGHPAFVTFEGETAASAVLRILRDPVPPLLVDGVPMALSDLLVTAMTKEPTERPSSALAFAEALRSIERAQLWPQTSYVVVGESHAFESTPLDSIEAAAHQSGSDAWSRWRSVSQHAEQAEPAASITFAPRARPARRTRTRIDRSALAPVALGSAKPTPPTLRHAPAAVVVPISKDTRRVLTPNALVQVPSRRVVAGVPAPTTSPNTGRSTGSPDPLLALLSRSAAPPPPARDEASSRFAAAPSIKAVGAAATPHPPSVVPDVPDAELLGPAPDPGLFGFPSPLAEVPSAPDTLEESLLRRATADADADDSGPKSADPN